MLAITGHWLGVAIFSGISLLAFLWGLTERVRLRRKARTDIGRLNREIWMNLAYALGCGAALVALFILDPTAGN